MARYIDAEKADVESISCFYGSECRIEDVQEWLNEQPTADVVEVKHGEWEQNPYCKRIYFCSVCGRHIEDGSCNPYEHFPYCHCGAKMDGGADNGNTVEK